MKYFTQIVLLVLTTSFSGACFAAAKTGCFYWLGNLAGKSMRMQIIGRAPAEHRFKTEAAEIASAKESDLVSVEWLFHPFYYPGGHTSIRVGNSLYEFIPGGWAEHAGGKDSARGFIFNNPYFKAMYETYESQGMPPYSVGVPFRIPRSDLRAILQSIEEFPDKSEMPFNYFLRNCNHCPAAIFAKNVEVFPSLGRFQNFSCIATTKALLTMASTNQTEINIYPLPGIDKQNLNLATSFPRYLVEDKSTFAEVLHLLAGLTNVKGIYMIYQLYYGSRK